MWRLLDPSPKIYWRRADQTQNGKMTMNLQYDGYDRDYSLLPRIQRISDNWKTVPQRRHILSV